MTPERTTSRLFVLADRRTRALLLVASAVLAVLAYPTANWDLLIWVSLVPLLCCALTRLPHQALADGWLTGAVFFTLLLRWLDHTFRTYSAIPWPLTWLPILGLAGYCGLYTGAVAAGVSWVSRRLGPGLALASAPFFWVAGEWIRGHLLSGFPWGLLGYSQAFVLPVIQIAEWTGVYGISFVIVSVNAALAGAITLGWRRAGHGAGAAALLLLLTLGVGWYSLGPGSERSVRVVVVQPSINQAEKWERTVLERTLAVYDQLTLEAKGFLPALVIWPETAVPLFLRQDPVTLEHLRLLSVQVRAPLLLGAVDADPPGTRRYFNSAFFLWEQGIEGKYDKIHLVPFGEYVPLSKLLGFVRAWAAFISEFESGEGRTLFPLRDARFGVVICYEGLFPELFREFVAEGAQFMVNITNDAWFGETSGPWQHLAVLPLRAAENRVAIARAANTGVSAIVEPSGRISQTLGLFRRGILEDLLPARTRATFYTRHGDLFAYACLGFSVAVLAGARLGRTG